MMEFFFSNRIESLYQELKRELFFKEKSNPFATRLIIVPSVSLKSWLMLEMAKDEELGIAIGVDICLLDQAMEKLEGSEEINKELTELELSLMIEVQINKWIREKKENYQELFEYLKCSNDHLSRKSQKRLTSLSLKLATLFIQYGTYGGKWLETIEQETGVKGFQIELWKTIFQSQGFSYLKKNLETKSVQFPLEKMQVYLFSLSFLPKIHYDYFSRISGVKYYLLSPCQAFWSDLQSNRQHAWCKRYVKNKLDVQLDQFLAEQNPLLANFGRIGKEMAKLIEESSAITHSSYTVSKGIAGIDFYEMLVFDELILEDKELSLLSAVQADLVLLRQPAKGDKIHFKKEDDSIQLHIASSRSREIQILYDTLLTLILKHEHKDPLQLNTIIVMAPNIMDYVPFIHSVFGSKISVLDYHVTDLNSPYKNAVLQDFLHLLSLHELRFSADALLTLFSSSYFQKCHQLTKEDIETIREWFIDADFRWSYDEKERREWFYACSGKEIEVEGAHGTLNYCLDRLLAALMIKPTDEEMGELQLLPIEAVSLSDAPLLGKLASISHSLKMDLSLIVNESEMTLNEWISYLKCLGAAYFGINEDDENLTEDVLVWLKSLNELKKCIKLFPEELFSFNTIKTHLERIFKRETMDFQSTHLNSIRFCSMLPMRAIPAEVIVLIGLNENAFPRLEDKNSLDLSDMKKCDYKPSKTDYDRYLFLEAILSARTYFILSYVESNLNKNSKGSLVVTEFVNYLNDGYKIGDQTFTETIKKHPFHAFDRRYFEKNSCFQSYSHFNYDLSVKFYNQEKLKNHQFFSDFKIKTSFLPDLKEVTITLKELKNFATNPLKTYFNQTLGIYLNKTAPSFKTDENFVISPLDFSMIKKLSLKKTLGTLVDLVEKKGMMPNGLFKNITLDKIQNEICSLDDRLKRLDIDKDKIFSLNLGVDAPHELENGSWQLPSLKFNYQNQFQVTIQGSFSDVCSKGLIVHADDERQAFIKFWPEFLVFSCLMDRFPIAEKQLIFLKSGKIRQAFFDDALMELEKYLTYYFKGLNNPSPLVPEWAYQFVHESQNSLSDELNKSLIDEYHPIYNDYLHWVRNERDDFYCQSFHEEWSIQAKDLFLKLYECWLSK